MTAQGRNIYLYECFIKLFPMVICLLLILVFIYISTKVREFILLAAHHFLDVNRFLFCVC